MRPSEAVTDSSRWGMKPGHPGGENRHAQVARLLTVGADPRRQVPTCASPSTVFAPATTRPGVPPLRFASICEDGLDAIDPLAVLLGRAVRAR